MRYDITVEVTKDGRKKLTQYCVHDILEDKVVARFAQQADAQAVIDRYLLSTIPVEE